MPVVFREEEDLFRLAPFTDVLINPVNCVGAMGRGLAAEFKERYPVMYERYKEICNENKLTVGKLYVYRPEKGRHIVVNLPTKIHYGDDSDPTYIKKGLLALRRFLEVKENIHLTVDMPMLGCGYGNLEQDSVKPLFEEMLDDLPNVINVTQRADQFPSTPKFLVIFGSRSFGREKIDGRPNPFFTQHRQYMIDKIQGTLKEWGLTISDFQAVVSGGAVGTDTLACGEAINTPSQKDSVASELVQGTKTKVIVAKADWDRYKKGAGFMRNEFMADLGTHFIGFKPKDIATPGTDHMVELLGKCNTGIAKSYDDPKTSRFYKTLKVWGEDLTPGKTSQVLL